MGAAMKIAGWACISLFNYCKENKATLTAVSSADLRLYASCALATGNLAFPYLDEVIAESADIATSTVFAVGLKDLNGDPPAKFANTVWNRMLDADFAGVS